MKDRIYVCHTFYHVYITYLKELAIREQLGDNAGGATLVLSLMSNDFRNMKANSEKTGIFEEVIEFDEKRNTFFPELDKYKVDHGNAFINLIYRIIFTRKYAKLEEKYVPVDFSKYKEIYVYSDPDPIGYYLNYKKIKYHAIEDGLDSLKTTDEARLSNIGHFGLKCWMAEHGLIFMENGHSKYAIDMEVNNRSVIKYDYKKYKEVPRAPLYDRLTKEDKEILLTAFVDNVDEIKERISECNKAREEKGLKSVMILSDPLCDLETRKRIMKDIIDEYCEGMMVFIKPHPRDELDYRIYFSEYPQFAPEVPMEMLNYFEGIHFDKVISVFTELGEIKYADEKIRLSSEFMDKYEDRSVHWHNEKI